jgi:hypothetical protein
LEREYGRLVNHCRAANRTAGFSIVNIAQCRTGPGKRKAPRHLAPNTAFKMIEGGPARGNLEIQTTIVRNGGTMPLQQLLLKRHLDHLDRSLAPAGTLDAYTLKEAGRSEARPSNVSV